MQVSGPRWEPVEFLECSSCRDFLRDLSAFRCALKSATELIYLLILPKQLSHILKRLKKRHFVFLVFEICVYD